MTAVDSNSEVIEELTNVYDVMGVCGNGVDYETLEEAQVEQAELFVASTKSDELNMLSCFLAKKMGAKQTIARIRNPEYNDSSLSFVRQQLGLSMSINPELLAAQELSDLLKLPGGGQNRDLFSPEFRDDRAAHQGRFHPKRCKVKRLAKEIPGQSPYLRRPARGARVHPRWQLSAPKRRPASASPPPRRRSKSSCGCWAFCRSVPAKL